MLNKSLMLLVLSVFAAGCGIESHTYVMEKPRVGYDQIGNGGCLTGKCLAPAPPAETTRKIYVWELTKPVPESEVQKIESKAIDALATTPNSSTDATAPMAPSEVSPTAEEASGNAGYVSGPPSMGSTGKGQEEQTYTVVKDDTLQKISKKFYGTYSKWYKIYRANKDKIKNPNILRSGTVLTIPALK